jgi:hypothetical protein
MSAIRLSSSDSDPEDLLLELSVGEAVNDADGVPIVTFSDDVPLEPGLDEVDDELAKELDNAVAVAVAVKLSPVRDELEDLLRDAMARAKETANIKAARARLVKGGNSSGQVQEDVALIAQWEAAHEWEARATVAVFDVTHCACGAAQTTFSGLMQRQDSRFTRHARRWVVMPHVNDALPREVGYRNFRATLCLMCAPAGGWDLSTGRDIS